MTLSWSWKLPVGNVRPKENEYSDDGSADGVACYRIGSGSDNTENEYLFLNRCTTE